MPVYEVEDTVTGRTIELEGDSPPTEQELEEIFASIEGPHAGTQTPQPQGDPRLSKSLTLGEMAEPLVTFGTAAMTEPTAGIAGLVQTVNPFADPGAGELAVKGTREALTFQPRTEEGKIGLQKIARLRPVQSFVEAIQFAEKTVGDTFFDLGGPAGGAFGSTLPTAVLEAMGLGALKKLRLGKADFIDASGQPTPELQEALKKSGLSFDDLTPEAKAELSNAKQGTSVAETARRSRFQEQGIPFTKGDVTQDFRQLSKEQRLLSMIGEETSEPLRQLKFEQSEAFVRNVDELVESLGVSGKESGEVLKGALEGRLKLLRKEKNDLYKEFADTAPELSEIPIIPDSIADALPDKAKARRIERVAGTQSKALDDLLVEFGIDDDPAKVKAFTEAGNDITPLNIGNFDDFRQAINLIERSDQTGAIQSLTGPIKTALDNEAALIDDAVTAAGVADEGVLAPLKQARQTVRQIKTEFSPQAITGKLTDFKRDGVTPVVEASKAVDQVIGKNVPIEFLERTLESLNKAGKDGKTAIKALQAAVILKAMDNAFKAPTRKFAGTETIGTNAFDRSLREFGDARLNLLFKDDPALLKRVKDLQKIAFDITPPNATTPKGSAPIILDMMNRLGRVPVAGEVVNFLKMVTKPGFDNRAVNKAIKARPTFSKARDLIKREFPNLFVALQLASFDEPIKTQSEGRDQGSVERREEFRGISRGQEQALAEDLGFGDEGPDKRGSLGILFDELNPF